MAATPGNDLNLTGSAGIVLFDGTSAVTTTAPTNHAILIGTGTNSFGTVASGTTGQVLQAATGANPAYSTATYPSTAGTSGNVLTSDGTNWNSSAPPGAGLLLATGTMTSANIKAAHGTPFQVIAAPGAGKVIHVVGSIMSYVYGGTNVFVAGASQLLALYYGTSNQISGNTFTSIANAVLTGTVNSTSVGQGQFDNNTAVIENSAINIYNNVATEITGNAANNNVINYSIVYYIL